ncbi:MAG TPA: metal ABC transporter permease [Chloroflexota bacterium]|nr:metal ABC transporter permease [Chloroflexota bacterium]
MIFEPLQYDFMQNAYAAGTVIAIVSAVVGFFVVLRGLSFAAHALSHIGFAGATGAVLLSIDPLLGLLAFTVVSGLAMGLLGERVRGRDVAIGIVLAFALGLGALFLSLYTRYATQAYSILFGTILGVSTTDVAISLILGVVVLVAIVFLYRPLIFASIDPEVAAARGVPVDLLSALFMVVVAVAVAEAVQVVGVLLVFTLIVAPAATAGFLTSRPSTAILVSVVIALLETWLGITMAFYTKFPVSFYIASLGFAFYLLGRFLGPGLHHRTESARSLEGQMAR